MSPSQPQEPTQACKDRSKSQLPESRDIVDLTGDGADLGKHDRDIDLSHTEHSGKRRKLATDNQPVASTRKTVTIPKKEYRKNKTLTKKCVRLQKACTSKHQESIEHGRRMNDELEDHAKTKRELQELQGLHYQMRAELTVENERFSSEVQIQKRTIAAKDEKLQSKDHIIEVQRADYDRLSVAFERYKNWYEKLQASSMEKDASLAEKDRLLDGERKENEDLKLRIKATQEERDSAMKEVKSTKTGLRQCQNALAKREEEFQSRGTELQNTRAELDRKQAEIDSLRIVNDRNGMHNERLRLEHTRHEKETALALGNAKTENKDLDKQIIGLKRTIADKEKALGISGEVQSQLETRESEWNKKKFELINKIRHLEAQQRSISNYREPDQQIEQVFADLKFKIRQFINRHLKSVSDAADRGLEPVWHELMPDPAKFLKSRRLYHPAFEAYIWESILGEIVEDATNVWAGELGGEFLKMLHMAHDEVKGLGPLSELHRDYQKWRAFSCDIFERLTKRYYSPELFLRKAEVMVESFCKLCDILENKRALDDILEIFNDARSFFIMLKKLRADFRLCRHRTDGNGNMMSHGFNFDDSTMEDANDSQKGSAGKPRTVDLVISPALIKRGNNDGTDYQTTICITKRKVICDHAKIPLKTKAPGRAQTQPEHVIFEGSATDAQQFNPAEGATMETNPTNRTKTENTGPIVKIEDQGDEKRGPVSQSSSRTLSSGSVTGNRGNFTTTGSVMENALPNEEEAGEEDDTDPKPLTTSGSEGQSPPNEKDKKWKKKTSDEQDGDYKP
ncbi:hypothetical protein diail_6845 [Diaporthe ilicicola]|nr:hypothetical protein diail_6845 [Diaporthe ilicicola]